MKKMKLNIQLFSATCTVSVKSITQSIANNSSTITIHGKLSTDSSSYNYGGAYMQPIISNQPVIGTQTSSQTLSKYKYNIGKSSSKEDDWTFTVYHNNNGTCNNLTIQIKWYVSDSTNGTKTLTNGYTPDTIARASSVSASDGTLNVADDVSISITRQDNSFTHTLRYVCGNDSGWIKDVNNKVATSANWTPPLSLANQNKTDYSLSCKIYCQTYNGSTPIGDEKYDEITLTIPSLSPTATLGTVNDNTSYKSTYGAFIQNKSTIKVSLSGSAQYSDISSYSWEIRQTNSSGLLLKSSSGSYTGSLNISYTPTVSGTLYIKGTVTDKRGASDSTDTTVSVTAYSPPTCSLVVSRVNSTSASYTMSGTGTAISNAGYTANTLEFKLVRGSTTVRSTSNGASYTGTDTIADQSYTYTLTAKDTISGTTDTKTVTIATTFTLMNFSASGKAMAIGKASEATGNNSLFEVAMDTNIIGTLGADKISNSKGLYWKEDGYGDKFRIIPEFNGFDDNNKLKITGAVGGAGTDPSEYVLMAITGKNGNVWHKGYVESATSLRIPRNSASGYGLTNSAGNSIIRDWNNGAITIDAVGGDLFLGYANTTNVYTNSNLITNKVLQINDSYRGYHFSGDGTPGYKLIGTFKITATYANQPIIFDILQRNRHGKIYVQFTSSNSTDPSLTELKTEGNISAYMYKSATSTWNLYVYKSEGWDSIEAVMLKGYYSDNITWTWGGTTASSLPSGYVTATPYSGTQKASGSFSLTNTTGSSGSLNYVECGKVLFVEIQFTSKSSSTSAGNDCYVGKIPDGSNSWTRPYGHAAELCGFYSSCSLICSITTDGTVTVRVLGATLSASSTGYVRGTYIIS